MRFSINFDNFRALFVHSMYFNPLIPYSEEIALKKISLQVRVKVRWKIVVYTSIFTIFIRKRVATAEKTSAINVEVIRNILDLAWKKL